MYREKIRLKKSIRLIGIGVILIVAISLMIVTYPMTVYRSYEGVEFRLGANNKETFQKVTVVVDGKFSRNALLGHKFKGKIIIGDTTIPEQIDEIELKFEKQGTGQVAALDYFYYDHQTNRTEQSLYGWMIIDDAINHIMIQVAESHEDGGKGWDSGDGLTIVAPAITRAEAVVICNKFFEGTSANPFE